MQESHETKPITKHEKKESSRVMKTFKFKIHDNNYRVNLISHNNNTIDLEVNGTNYSVTLDTEVKKSKTPTLVRSASKRPIEPLKVSPAAKKTKILAPIPGVILEVDVKVGDAVKKGDRLVQLEAMKMENNIVAEKEGTVIAVHVAKDQKVLEKELMIEME
jgi:biotin carboxyl carrier protein